MNDIRRTRLMNVGSVVVQTPTGFIEHRPTIVEISARPKSSTIVMYEVDPIELLTSMDQPAPRMLGRIHHHGRTVLLDPLRWGDGRSWRLFLRTGVRSETTEVLIHPPLNEGIWIDHAFAQPPSDDTGRELHNRKRLCMFSLMVQARMLQESMEPAAKNIYRQNCKALEDALHDINRRLGRGGAV